VGTTLLTGTHFGAHDIARGHTGASCRGSAALPLGVAGFGCGAVQRSRETEIGLL
jgi:hypothetical protein